MAKKEYLSFRISKPNTEKLHIINNIIEDYKNQGYVLTLRQLYYQLVSRDIIPNKQSEYAKLSSLLVKGRMAGIVDWDAIEDRLRVPYMEYCVNDVEGAIEDTIQQYKLDRMRNQEVYVELWVEKDALSGVLKSITQHYHINLMVNRGYSSCTAIHDAFKRFRHQFINLEKTKCVILYLGDHDPSGLDMIRDINNRLSEFGLNTIEIIHIGLTMEQISQYNPPPNPAKITDPRAAKYIAEFGNISWEVDALNPKTLHELVRSNVENLIDPEKFNTILNMEQKDKISLEKLQTLASKEDL